LRNRVSHPWLLNEKVFMKLRVLALATIVFAALGPVSSQAFVAVSVGFAPPVLPVYDPGPVPVAGYIWTPGYWAWDPVVGYYWVPGAWVPPPTVGFYWTPPWWGFANGLYVFHEGYWGPRVGFYGGINYGYGYFGSGYWGGRWAGNVFEYNTTVVRVNKTVIKNVYVDRTVLSRQAQARTTRASFNGPGGVQAQPSAEEKAAEAEARKTPPTQQQLARREAAAKNRDLQAKVNKGHPKPEAIKTFNKTHEQAQAGARTAAERREAAERGGAAERRETAATARTKAATERETRAQGARERTNAQAAERRERANAQTVERRERANAQIAERRERGAAERREAELRSMRARENANAARQREMTQRSRRPEVAPGRQVSAGARRAEPAPQQQRSQQQAKKKPAKQSDERER
jgi:hypothetical protein